MLTNFFNKLITSCQINYYDLDDNNYNNDANEENIIENDTKKQLIDFKNLKNKKKLMKKYVNICVSGNNKELFDTMLENTSHKKSFIKMVVIKAIKEKNINILNWDLDLYLDKNIKINENFKSKILKALSEYGNNNTATFFIKKKIITWECFISIFIKSVNEQNIKMLDSLNNYEYIHSMMEKDYKIIIQKCLNGQYINVLNWLYNNYYVLVNIFFGHSLKILKYFIEAIENENFDTSIWICQKYRRSELFTDVHAYELKKYCLKHKLYNVLELFNEQ